MRAGEIRHRITLQQPVETRSAFGEVVISYSDVATVWAAIDWRSGRRYEAAAQLNSEIEGVVRIRYYSGVKPYWRISFDDRTFIILSITNTKEQNAEMILYCKEALD